MISYIGGWIGLDAFLIPLFFKVDLLGASNYKLQMIYFQNLIFFGS